MADSGTDQWANGYRIASASANSPAYRAQRTDACLEQTSVASATETMHGNCTSMDADGFTVNFSVNTDGAVHVFSLALAGLNFNAGSFSKNTLVPAFVQQTAGKIINRTNAQTLGAASTKGNLIVATVSYDGAQTITSVTDSKLNTYNLAVGPTAWGPGNTYHTATYYASNIVGGAGAITVTSLLSAGTPTSFHELYVLEYSGVAAVNPLDECSAQAVSLASPGDPRFE